MTPKFCKDCRHFDPIGPIVNEDGRGPVCKLSGHHDLVTGKMEYARAAIERGLGNCGSEGLKFEPLFPSAAMTIQEADKILSEHK